MGVSQGTALEGPETAATPGSHASERQLLPVTEAICNECGMRAYRTDSGPLDLSQWRDRLCPRCVRDRAARETADLSRGEVEERVLAALKNDPARPRKHVAVELGVPAATVRHIASRAPARGDLPNVEERGMERNPRRLGPAERKRRAEERTKARLAEDLRLLEELGEASQHTFAEPRGCAPITARRALRKLVDAGLAESREIAVRGGTKIVYRPT
jgi:hypothetical protein